MYIYICIFLYIYYIYAYIYNLKTCKYLYRISIIKKQTFYGLTFQYFDGKITLARLKLKGKLKKLQEFYSKAATGS